MTKILGLDLGTNSIGWALVNIETKKIQGIGSHIFSPGVNYEKGNEISKNATRREKRQIRRQTFRRKRRKRKLAQLLSKYKMFPVIYDLETEITKEKLNEELKDFFAINPYECRAKAYKGEKLSLNEIGRIFYQFAQRRGYKESLKTSEQEDEGKIYDGKPKEGIIGINQTREKIKEFGTLGNYLNNEDPHKTRLRNRYTTRNMYLDEFEITWESQRKYYPEILTDELKTTLGDHENGILFYQRTLRSQKHLIGHCTFEPDKPRCPISAIPFEEFRMHQFINSIKHGENPLDENERQIVVELINSKEKKFDFKELKKKLKLEKGTFNYKDDYKITGNRTISSFRKIFGKKRWDSMSNEEKEKVWHIKLFATSKEWLSEYAKTNWELDDKSVEKLLKFRYAEDYSNLSRKAINNILPYFKEGKLYNEAVLLGGLKKVFGAECWKTILDEEKKTIEDTVIAIAGQKSEPGKETDKIKNFLRKQYKLSDERLSKLYHHSFLEKAESDSKKLPEPENLRNPIVQQALYELRKVVNEIIKEYGKPEAIKVELARELKMPKKMRDKIKFDNMENEKRNDEAKKVLDDYNKPHSRANIQKVILWEECDHSCPYTGEKIGVHELFDDGYVQVEHIIPYSVSLNDSMQNKTLCLADENKAKGDRTPFQFYGSNDKKWDEVKNRAYKLFKNNYPKYKRFISKQIPDVDEFISSQLNDTRYISKASKNYLKSIFSNVDVTQGSATALLRHYWGLDTILNKSINIENLEDGEYYGAVDENNQFVDILEWNFNTKEKDLESLKKKGKLLQGKVKDGKFYSYKTRDDHRHHAIDALTVALTKKSYLQKISTLKARGLQSEDIFEKYEIPKPWEKFWEDANNAVQNILITHKKTDRIITKIKKPLFDYNGRPRKDKNGKIIFSQGEAARGELHKESVYGKHTGEDGKEYFHITKPLEKLTSAQIKKIVDKGIRDIILNRIKEMGVNTEQKKFDVPKGTFFDYNDAGNKIPKIFIPNKNGEPIPVKKVRIRETIGNAEMLKELNQYVNPMHNHHVAIYKNENGDFYEKVVTFWEAVERVKQGLPAINKQQDDGSEFVTSLQINDLFLLGLTDEEYENYKDNKEVLSEHLYKVEALSSKYYEFRLHNSANTNDENRPNYVRIQGFGSGITGWQSFNPRKVQLSVLGKIITEGIK